MKHEEIENNKLIAEFMGAEMIVTNYHGINIIKFPDESTKDLRGLKYNSSWDWLMPVVERIESIKPFIVTIDRNGCWIGEYFGEFTQNQITFHHESEGNKITIIWLAVVEFIKWYNKQ